MGKRELLFFMAMPLSLNNAYFVVDLPTNNAADAS